MAKQLVGDRRSHPLDGNLRFADGRRLFGPSKTVRGVILAVLATAAGAVILGLDWRVGAIMALRINTKPHAHFRAGADFANKQVLVTRECESRGDDPLQKRDSPVPSHGRTGMANV